LNTLGREVASPSSEISSIKLKESSRRAIMNKDLIVFSGLPRDAANKMRIHYKFRKFANGKEISRKCK